MQPTPASEAEELAEKQAAAATKKTRKAPANKGAQHAAELVKRPAQKERKPPPIAQMSLAAKMVGSVLR